MDICNKNFLSTRNFHRSHRSEHTFTSIGFDGVVCEPESTANENSAKAGSHSNGKSFLSVLFGEFRSQYTQFDVTTSTTEASSHWLDNRVLPILENRSRHKMDQLQRIT